ncbi:MAG TPA: hypothetical protein DCL06_06270 [Corynebacterium variabile]|uniref:Uncharacterized protein n=1 Tax=Corynebacterium variabile TaxID=1727 RepID=A0A3B9QU90_9CORY|nr:hypothetical protein [Corynebacterium variabile]
MTDPAPNHLRIYRDKHGKHATLDGHELLVDGDDGLLITGAENQDEITRVMITLLSPKVTIESELTDQEPELKMDMHPMTADYEEVVRLRAETQRLTALLSTTNRAHGDTVLGGVPSKWETANPADVPEDQPWLIQWRGNHAIGVRNNEYQKFPWICTQVGEHDHVMDKDVRLVCRLTASHRTITTAEELDALPNGAIIQSHKRGEIMRQKNHGEWYALYVAPRKSEDVDLPAAVIYEPEAVACRRR